MTGNPKGPARWFADEFTQVLGTVLESLAGERPKLSCTVSAGALSLAATSKDIVEKHGKILWWQQRFPLPGEPSTWLGAPRNAWVQIAGRILGADSGEDDSQARETYLEVLQQSFGLLGRSASSRWNQKVDATGNEASGMPESADFYTLDVVYPDAALPPLLVAITGTPQDPPAEEEPAPAAAAPDLLGPEIKISTSSRTFSLLMDVELPVSVSFGHVQLPLKDVLKLTAGSIIELNRTVDEPVEVIVNNCVVARGEVVVVEGNYGVRIHEIMSRQERLETLP